MQARGSAATAVLGLSLGFGLVLGLLAACDAPSEHDVRPDAPNRGTPDGAVPGDGAMPDAPPVKLWIFTTNATLSGDFGATGGGRAVADAACGDTYQRVFTQRQCSTVRAVIQVDDTSDTLDRMAIGFRIPLEAAVFRATDETKVSERWDQLIDPDTELLAPVSDSASSVHFWSGRVVGQRGLNCDDWRSDDLTRYGAVGDATLSRAWMSRVVMRCLNSQALLCVCW